MSKHAALYVLAQARLPEWLARCHEGAGGCLLWPGQMDKGSPAVMVKRQRLSLRRVVLEARLGRPIRAGYVAAVTCEHAHCVASECVIEVTRKVLGRLNAAPKPMDYRLRIAAAKQAGSTKLDWPRVREIRARLCAGETERAIAASYGVTRRMVGLIGQGKCWRESTPFSV